MTYDFIIVGAGIAGASLAYELASSGSVCLIEAEPRPGMHATGRSAALFAPTYGGREIRAVTRASRAFFDRPPAGFSEHPLLNPRGCLYIARAEQGKRLDDMVDTIRASGGNVSAIDVREALVRVPLMRAGYLAAAAFDSDAMDIDVDALHRGFIRGARSAGVRLITGARTTQIERHNRVWSVDVNSESFSAPVLVNAAGAWADEVAQACGADRLGLQPFRRTAVLVDAPEGVDVRRWPAVIDADEEFYFKPDAGQLLLSPADEVPQGPGDAQPEEWDVAVGVERVEAALDIEVRRVRHSWAGLRTFAPDRVPVVGFDARVEGFFWCAGQGGYGIQTAPAMARSAAALVKHESLPADVAAQGLKAADLSPSRFTAR
jgi:D-arginine dehydrogenase